MSCGAGGGACSSGPVPTLVVGPVTLARFAEMYAHSVFSRLCVVSLLVCLCKTAVRRVSGDGSSVCGMGNIMDESSLSTGQRLRPPHRVAWKSPC